MPTGTLKGRDLPSSRSLTVHRLPRSLTAWLLVSLAACQSSPSVAPPTPERPQPLPQAERLQVYTNHNPANHYTEPYRRQDRDGDNLEQIMIDGIASAQRSVDVAVQELRLPGVAKALVKRQQAGVKVRVILENTYARPLSQVTPHDLGQLPARDRDRYEEFRRLVDTNQDHQLSPEEIATGDALVLLDQAHVPRLDDTADGSAGSNLMHHKFVVIDGQTLIVTSANFTPSDVHGDFSHPSSQGNANNLVKIQSAELAALFTAEFELMWGDGPGGKPNSRFGRQKPARAVRSIQVGNIPIDVHFSPSPSSVAWKASSNGVIAKTLQTATRSVNMALFVFSDQQLANALLPLQRQGIEIQAVIEPGFAYRSYSEALDLLGIALAEDCYVEPNNQPWQPGITSIGVPRLPPGDLLHNKFGVVDSQTVIMGSHNWTEAANTGNDETLLVIHSPIVAAHYQREFDRLYKTAIVGIPPAIRKKAATQLKQCGSFTARAIANDPDTLGTAVAQSKSGSFSTSSPRQAAQPKVAQTKVAQVPQVQQPTPPQTSVTPRQRINLNTATSVELETLPGVGATLAKRIMAARQKRRFTSLADLDRVPGVGSKLLHRLAAHVTW